MEKVENRQKTLLIDFYGVICSEVAPRWFAQYFDTSTAEKYKEEFCEPFDRGEIGEETLFHELEVLVKTPAETIREEWRRFARIDAEVIKLLLAEKQNRKIALASNAGSSLREILRTYSIEPIFDTIVISSDIGLIKPDPNFFTKALELLDESPANVFFVDDNQVNTNAAEALGIESHLFTDADSLREVLTI